jgi:pimeloyl-ACP methyl ester carboxylesterase
MQFARLIGEFASGRCTASQTPSVSRDLRLDVDSLRIHCLGAGSRDCPVLILHGGGLDAAGLSFRKTIPILAEQHRVFASDWPGFGQSEAMPITWRVEECVDFVGEL